MPSDHKPSVVIVGAGEFGAATACSLLKSGRYGPVTVLDRAQTLPAVDAASCDINKVVRYDYADPMYSDLAREAIREWNKPEWKGIYHQSGVVVRGMEVPGHHGQSMLDTYNNVRKGNPTVKLLETPEEFVEKLAPSPGIQAKKPLPHVRGYYNGWGGWANASKAVEKLYVDLHKLGGELVSEAELAKLIYTEDGSDVLGVKCVDGREFRGNKVILAMGSWTPSHPALAGMLPKGLITATGQTIAAIQLAPEDHKRYAEIPVSMHHDGSSYYSFPPNEEGLLKFALHGAGYLSDTGVPRTATDAAASAWTEANARGWIPKESLIKLREQLGVIYPELAAMPVAFTRMCWYSDVVDGDWVIDYSPKHPSVLFATGGAGHAFKFLPIIGDLIVSRLEGRLDSVYAHRWRVTRKPTAVDPARVGLQRKPLMVDDLVTRTEMLVPGDAPIAHL